MTLTLSQTAQALGKTPRQVRYLIKTGKLAAHKDGTRWVIRSEDLPLSPAQRRGQRRKAEALQGAITSALAPYLPPEGRRGYSVRQLAAFSAGQPCWKAAVGLLGESHPAVIALQSALLALGQGCHRYHTDDKLHAYRRAREEAAAATVHLLLSEHTDAEALAGQVEQSLLPALGGLIRHHEHEADR